MAAVGRQQLFAALLLLIAVLAWVGYQQLSMAKPARFLNPPFDPACDLRAGPCVSVLEGGGRVRFSIEPRTIPVTEALQLRVEISGLRASQVSVDINGVDMKMPINPVELKQLDEGVYVGTTNLSFCSRSLMEWESVVQLTTERSQINLPFRFITQH